MNHRRHHAQVLAEFAVVLPLCLVMLAGIVDLGLLLQHHISLQTVLREGALVAGSGATDEQIKAAMVSLPGNLGLKATEIQIVRRTSDPALEKLDAGEGQPQELPGGAAHYETVEVQVAAHHDYLMPGFFPGGSTAKVSSSIKTFKIVP